CDLEETLNHVQQLLVPKGQLVLLEGTQPQRWLDLIFGLTEGWWRFTDTVLRSNYPLISLGKWESVLQKCGFAEVAGFDTQPQGVIVAQNNIEKLFDKEIDSSQWLIFADNHGFGEELARQLGSDCILVSWGSDYQQLDEFRYQVNPIRKNDFERLWESVTQKVVIQQVVHLWSLDIPTVSQITDEQIELSSQLGCASVLHLVQSINSNQSLWLVTQGVVNLDDKSQGVIQSPLWGLGKVISLEHPGVGGFCIDLDSTIPISEQSSGLISEILSNSNEEQVAFRQNQRFVPRLVRFEGKGLLEENLLSIPENQPFELGISKRGTLENLELQPITRHKPQKNEVEIQVQTTGLNFIDVLDALNLLPFERNWFGVECAGEIVAVGDEVKDFQPGDKVIALAPGSFSQFVTTDARMVILKPDNLNFEEAATIPANFLTAYYALNKIAKISTAQRILIHAAAGGTGMAAVKIAQQAGAEVFATASPWKWENLEAMGIKRENIFNSRTLDFAEETIGITQGKGVDIVLNSLSGDFIDKSFAVLKDDGCFLEIGKRDVWSSERVKQVKPNSQYSLIDLMSLAQQQPDLIQLMLSELMLLFENEQLKPLPHQVFPIQNVISAFRYMQQAKHIGKVVVSTSPQKTSPPTPLLIKERGENGTYLIT
ncbi:MAG: zinc-binding dehydrogenase, partial [Cyanobacteria bacterium J06649_11]